MTNPGTPHHPGFREVPWNGKASVETGPTRLSTSRPQPGSPVPYNASSNKLQSEKVTLDSKGIWANRYEAKAFAYALPPVNAEGVPTGAVPALLVNLKTGEQIILTPGAGFRFDSEFQVKSVESSLGAADADAVLWVSFGDVVPVSTFVPEAVSVTVNPAPSEITDIVSGDAVLAGGVVVGTAHGEAQVTGGVNQYFNLNVPQAGGTLNGIVEQAVGLARIVFNITGAAVTTLTGAPITVGIDGHPESTAVYDQDGFLVSQVGKIQLINMDGGAKGRYTFYVDMTTANDIVVTVPPYTGVGAALAAEIAVAPENASIDLQSVPQTTSAYTLLDPSTGDDIILTAGTAPWSAGTELWMMGYQISSSVGQLWNLQDSVAHIEYDGGNIAAMIPVVRDREKTPIAILENNLTIVSSSPDAALGVSVTYGLVNV